jgi:hypothetical protein
MMDENETMIERVAAVFRGACESGTQFSYKDVARAAIEAMREPTEAMIEARKRRQATGTSLSYEQIIAEEFTAMIDAALNPQTSP